MTHFNDLTSKGQQSLLDRYEFGSIDRNEVRVNKYGQPIYRQCILTIKKSSLIDGGFHSYANKQRK